MYIYIYIINIKEIIYLSWDGKMRDMCKEGDLTLPIPQTSRKRE